MPIPTKPSTQAVVNGWWIEGIPDVLFPHFETLEGKKQEGGNISIVDAGSNTRLYFSDQIIDFGEMTLTRTSEENADDVALDAFLLSCQRFGAKVNVTAVKTHNNVEVYRVLFEGFRFFRKGDPTWNVNSGDKFTVSWGATCDNAIKL